MTFISVLFPAPFSPISACTSPCRSSRSTPSSATVGPNDFLISESFSASIRLYPCHPRLKTVVKRARRFHFGPVIRNSHRQDPHAIVIRQRHCLRVRRQ